jgi:hypothetical protein
LENGFLKLETLHESKLARLRGKRFSDAGNALIWFPKLEKAFHRKCLRSLGNPLFEAGNSEI